MLEDVPMTVPTRQNQRAMRTTVLAASSWCVLGLRGHGATYAEACPSFDRTITKPEEGT